MCQRHGSQPWTLQSLTALLLQLPQFCCFYCRQICKCNIYKIQFPYIILILLFTFDHSSSLSSACISCCFCWAQIVVHNVNVIFITFHFSYIFYIVIYDFLNFTWVLSIESVCLCGVPPFRFWALKNLKWYTLSHKGYTIKDIYHKDLVLHIPVYIKNIIQHKNTNDSSASSSACLISAAFIVDTLYMLGYIILYTHVYCLFKI